MAQAAGFSLHAGVLAEAERRGALTWAKRLRCVFSIDIETCCAWGAAVRVIASIEDPGVIDKILSYLRQSSPPSLVALRPEPRAPPAFGD